MDSTSLSRTILYPCHVALEARLVNFGGWEMPVQYSSILEEHMAVRTAVGMFDISHMGQIFISGASSALYLESLLTNRVSKLSFGEGHYTFMLNPMGGVIDDLFLYRLGEEQWLLVVNASKIKEDTNWLATHKIEGIELQTNTAIRAAIAVQGPNAPVLMHEFLGTDFVLPERNHIVSLQGNHAFISATGYTGESGYELFLPSEEAVSVWNRLLELGVGHDLKPCGLGSRDTLRLEKCYPLNGSDLSPARTPLEAGLGIFVDLTKEDCIGLDALRAQRLNGIPNRLYAFRMLEKCPPPRGGYPVYKDDSQIGEVTSGTLSPSLSTGIGMAYLPSGSVAIGDTIAIAIRDKKFAAKIHKKPLYP